MRVLIVNGDVEEVSHCFEVNNVSYNSGLQELYLVSDFGRWALEIEEGEANPILRQLLTQGFADLTMYPAIWEPDDFDFSDNEDMFEDEDWEDEEDFDSEKEELLSILKKLR